MSWVFRPVGLNVTVQGRISIVAAVDLDIAGLTLNSIITTGSAPINLLITNCSLGGSLNDNTYHSIQMSGSLIVSSVGEWTVVTDRLCEVTNCTFSGIYSTNASVVGKTVSVSGPGATVLIQSCVFTNISGGRSAVDVRGGTLTLSQTTFTNITTGYGAISIINGV